MSETLYDGIWTDRLNLFSCYDPTRTCICRICTRDMSEAEIEDTLRKFNEENGLE